MNSTVIQYWILKTTLDPRNTLIRYLQFIDKGTEACKYKGLDNYEPSLLYDNAVSIIEQTKSLWKLILYT